jgi:hypothetical protein
LIESKELHYTKVEMAGNPVHVKSAETRLVDEPESDVDAPNFLMEVSDNEEEERKEVRKRRRRKRFSRPDDMD